MLKLQTCVLQQLKPIHRQVPCRTFAIEHRNRRLGVNGARLFMGSTHSWRYVAGASYGYSLSGALVTNISGWHAAVAELSTPAG